MANIKIKGEYPVVPTKAGEKPGVSLDVIVGEEARPIMQFIHNGQLYLPVGTDISSQLIATQDALALEKQLSEITVMLDTLADDTKKTPSEKIREALEFISNQVGAKQACIYLREHSDDIAQTTEIMKIGEGKQSRYEDLHKLHPDLPKYFSMLRQVMNELVLFETGKDRIIDYPITPDQRRQVSGYGMTASLKPNANKEVGRVQFLNIPTPVTEKERKIMQRCLLHLDTMVEHLIKDREDAPVFNGNIADHMQNGDSFTGAGDMPANERDGLKDDLILKDEDAVDMPGRGYCLNSRLDRNFKGHERRVNEVLKKYKAAGLDLRDIYDGPDFKLAIHLGRLLDAAIEAVKPGTAIAGEVLFANESQKEAYRNAALMIGIGAFLPIYTEARREERTSVEHYEEIISQFNKLITNMMKNKKISVYKDRDYAIPLKLNAFEPEMLELASNIAQHIDNQPGNHPKADLIEAVIRFADAAAETSYSHAMTVADALATLDRPCENEQNYAAYKGLIGHVVLPK